MASLSEVRNRLKKAAAKLSAKERAALQQAIRATRHVLATGSPDNLKGLIRRLEAIASRPSVQRALQKLAEDSGADKRMLVRALEQAARRYRR